MKYLFAFLIVTLLSVSSSLAQKTTAINFDRTDCYGNHHNLFAELDSGYCVVIEYFMTCNSCINAGHKIESIINRLNVKTPKNTRFYQFAYTNSYSCQTAKSFVTSNKFAAIPFDSGAAHVAYYGGFGMPTFVVLGGSDHKVLYTGIGFTSADTTDIAAAIQNFFGTSDVDETSSSDVTVSTDPTQSQLSVRYDSDLIPDAQFQLYTEQGRSVLQNQATSSLQGVVTKTFDISNLQNGVYFLNVRGLQVQRTRSFIKLR